MANIGDFLLDFFMFMEVAPVAAGIQKSEFEMDEGLNEELVEGELRRVPHQLPRRSAGS